jgi:uncharacterized protein YjdB
MSQVGAALRDKGAETLRQKGPTSRTAKTGWLAILLVVGFLCSALTTPGSAHALGLPRILLTITVAPVADSIGVGQTEQYTATGNYSDLSTKNLTADVSWSSSDTTAASISSGGLTTGLATGLSTITATDPSTSIAGTAILTVIPAVLLTITVAPVADSIGVGQTEQYTATGNYSDLSTKNLTADVSWSSSDTTAASISSGGLTTGLATGLSTITATDPSTSIAGTAILTVIPAVLLTITVAPVADSIGVGQTEQYTATGNYSDLSTKNLTADVSWSSSDTTAASISSGGLTTGLATGLSTITATDPSTSIAGTAILTVIPAVLLTITVAPVADSIGVGQTEQYTATGNYSDLSTKNLTADVSWSSSDTTAASISSGGLTTGLATGLSTITATDPSTSIAGTAILTVIPAVLLTITVAPVADSIGVGQTEQYTATGNYSDLSTKNLTADVSWSSSDTTAASISSGGLTTGLATGLSTITATDPSTSIAGTAILTVIPAVLLTITVAPVADSIGVGQTEQYTATGNYSDLSTKNLTADVSWSSSDTTAASISSGGLTTGLATGLSTITATDPSTSIAGTAILTVIPAVLLTITVAPVADSIGVGQTEQYTATGNYSDLSTKNLTADVSWSSSDTTAASISSGGLTTGLATGLSTITATDPSTSIAGTAILTVIPAVLLTITVAPVADSIGVGQTEQYTATGNYSDLSTKNLTADVSWSSSDTTAASISSGGLTTGLATGLSTITATDPSTSIAGTAILTVIPAVLLTITVAPVADSIGVGQTEQYTATGNYSDLSTKNLTADVSWSSSDTTAASISSGGLTTGLATGLSTITATDPSTSIAGTAILTVIPGTPVSTLSLSPARGRPHTAVIITGTGFVPGQNVTVTYMSGRRRPRLAKTVLCSTTVEIDGTFSCNAVIPRKRRAGRAGQKSLVATEQNGTQATTTFTLA